MLTIFEVRSFCSQRNDECDQEAMGVLLTAPYISGQALPEPWSTACEWIQNMMPRQDLRLVQVRSRSRRGIPYNSSAVCLLADPDSMPEVICSFRLGGVPPPAILRNSHGCNFHPIMSAPSLTGTSFVKSTCPLRHRLRPITANPTDATVQHSNNPSRPLIRFH